MEDSHFLKISWVITNFLFILKSDKIYIESPEFLAPSLNGSKWLLRFYPGDQAVKFVKVYLVCTDCLNAKDIKVCWELSFVSENGRIIFNSQSEYKSLHTNSSYRVPKYPTFFEVYVSRRDDFIVNDNFTVQCRIWKHGCNEDMITSVYEACTEIVVNKICLEWAIDEFEKLTNKTRLFRNGYWKPTFKVIASFSPNYPAKLNVFISQKNVNFPSLHLSCSLSLWGKGGILKQWRNETSFYNPEDCLSFINIVSKDELLKCQSDFHDKDVLSLKFDLEYSVGEQRSSITSSTVVPLCNPIDDSNSSTGRLVEAIGDMPEVVKENIKCKTISELSSSKEEFPVKSQTKVTEGVDAKDQCDESISRKDSAPLKPIKSKDQSEKNLHRGFFKVYASESWDCNEIYQKVSTSPKSGKHKTKPHSEENIAAPLNEQVQLEDRRASRVTGSSEQCKETRNLAERMNRRNVASTDEPPLWVAQVLRENTALLYKHVQHEDKRANRATDPSGQCKEQITQSGLPKESEPDDSKSVLEPEDRLLDEIKQLSDLRDDLTSLYQDKTLTDFALKIDKRWFPVHKTILAARSPVFKAMLTSDMTEADADVVEISDLDSATLEQLLQFMYTGSFSGSRCSTFNLYYAADKYQVMSLRQKCSDVLKEQLNRANVCEVLLLADRHQDEELKSVVQEFIVLNDHEIIPSTEWRQFLASSPLLAAETMQLVYLKKMSGQSVAGPSQFRF